MTEQPEQNGPALPPRLKRAYRRRKLQLMPRDAKPRVAEPKPSKVDEVEFAGLTVANCATRCGPLCFITGNVCGHPYKGGLQAPHRMQPLVLERFERARRYLKQQAIEKETSHA
jgi:hypothetical protein